MKPMNFKNDLEMWHKFAEFAEWLQFVATAQESSLFDNCTYYSYDDGAFEEYCHCPEIVRTKDFEAKEECWKCSFRKVMGGSQQNSLAKRGMPIAFENKGKVLSISASAPELEEELSILKNPHSKDCKCKYCTGRIADKMVITFTKSYGGFGWFKDE